MILTGKQIKAANRIGGIELMIPWPSCLPLPVGLAEDEERPANPAEAQYIIQQLPHDYLIQHDLVLVRRAVAVVERPTLPPHPSEKKKAPHYGRAFLCWLVMGCGLEQPRLIDVELFAAGPDDTT